MKRLFLAAAVLASVVAFGPPVRTEAVLQTSPAQANTVQANTVQTGATAGTSHQGR